MSKTFGLIAGIIVVFIWSGWIIVSKLGLVNQLTAWDITGIRFLTASIIVAPLLFFNKKVVKKIFSLEVFICSISGGILYIIPSLIGLESSQASNVGILVNGSLPILSVIIIYIWLREKIKLSKYIGILLIVISNFLILIYTNEENIFSSAMWFFMSAFFLSFYAISMKRWEIDIKTILFAVPIFNFITFVPIWILAPSNLFIASNHEILLQAFYQGIVVSLIALFLMSHCIHTLGAINVSTIMSLVPITVVIFSNIFLNEDISNILWISAIICTLGIIFYNISHLFTRKSKKSKI